jgi:hypothetical protein
MAYWIVKDKMGNFENQPDGFKVITAIENSFWRCECPSEPIALFVVEFPAEQEEQYWYYIWPSGKKLLADPFEGRVHVSEEKDSKGRRTYTYTQEQMDMRLALIKWLVINVWAPDKQRLENLDNATVQQYIDDINAFNNDVEAKEYVVNNLYYDL